eukprot:8141159-Lingulodinium_polyedra.AAC.1
MAAVIEDRLATGDRPEGCDIPPHIGHPKCFSHKGWEGSCGQKGLYCDLCTKWADADHVISATHRNRMRWQLSADASVRAPWDERWK